MVRSKPCCGECSFFKYEDMFGYGICCISDREQRCDDECPLQYTDKEIERVLHHFQKWRRGGKGEQPQPYIIDKGIDGAIRVLRQKRKENEADI